MSDSPDVKFEATLDVVGSNTEETQELVQTGNTSTKDCKSNTNRMGSKLQCHLCPNQFSCSSNLARHIKVYHIEHSYRKPKVKLYSCDLCQKDFSRTQSLWKHLETQHNTFRVPKVCSSPKNFKCDLCDLSFVRKFSLNKHKKNKHQVLMPPRVGCFKCSECQCSFPKKTSYFDHIAADHDIPVNVENLFFENAADFESWKSDVEKITVSYFRMKSTKYNKHNEYMSTEYVCHRSGSFVSKNTGKRRLKTGGSNKIGYFCPANMSVKAKKAGKPFPAKVSFISSHVGHAFEIEKLRIKQRERCQQVTNDIVSGFVNKLDEFSNGEQCSEIDRAIAMLTEMKNKKLNNVTNTNIEPQKKKRRKRGNATNVSHTGFDV